MNLLFDIGHPGHVHLLKHVIHKLKLNGHTIIITIKDIPIAKRLLEAEGFDYVDLGKKTDSIFGKAFNQLHYNYTVARLVFKHKIDIGIGSSITLPHVSFFTKMKSIILDDDDDQIQPFFVKYAHPFANVILTPNVIKRKSEKTIYYAGSHEVAYLHPKRFFPDINVIENIGLHEGEVFFVLRFVALKGHHDIGHSGISLEQKRILINYLKTKGRIFITSESPIEKEFEEYRLSIKPEDIHSLLYYATMFLGDSQTMTTEAAIIGTPALKCNTFSGILSVPNEIENKYKLCYAYTPMQFEDFFNHIQELLSDRNLKEIWKTKCNDFFKDKIDVTAFLVWFIENYPESVNILKENPDYQYNFK